MKCIRTEDAVGHVLCHDMTQIIPGVSKGPRFRKGHVVTEEDIPVLLSMGKENLFVWEMEPGMVHENDAAERLAALCGRENMTWSETKEGKIELKSAIEGVFLVDSARLFAVNSIDELMIATRRGGGTVHPGDKLAGTRVIPLIIREEKLRPFVRRTAAVITTGSEVAKGRIPDSFTPVVERKLAAFGIRMTEHILVEDGQENVLTAIEQMKRRPVDMILCTGGMSVDPDDSTPGAIKASGADIVTYGAPVLPGAMFLLGYYGDGRPVMGLPGCVMYAKATIFDLVLPRIAADVRLEKRDFVVFGEGGLCLGCESCTYPHCGFGR